MRLDGEIAIKVVTHFTTHGIPILAVYDSFIIQYDKSIELVKVMQEAVNSSLGFKINIKQEQLSLDEEDTATTSFKNTQKITKEYKKRLQQHEEWLLRRTNIEEENN